MASAQLGMKNALGNVKAFQSVKAPSAPKRGQLQVRIELRKIDRQNGPLIDP